MVSLAGPPSLPQADNVGVRSQRGFSWGRHCRTEESELWDFRGWQGPAVRASQARRLPGSPAPADCSPQGLADWDKPRRPSRAQEGRGLEARLCFWEGGRVQPGAQVRGRCGLRAVSKYRRAVVWEAEDAWAQSF